MTFGTQGSDTCMPAGVNSARPKDMKPLLERYDYPVLCSQTTNLSWLWVSPTTPVALQLSDEVNHRFLFTFREGLPSILFN